MGQQEKLQYDWTEVEYGFSNNTKFKPVEKFKTVGASCQDTLST